MAETMERSVNQKVEFYPEAIVKKLFNVDLTPTQANILRAIIRGEKRIIISAMTRYGKSYVVSMAVILYVLLNADKRVVIVSATYPQAKILMNYIGRFIAKPEVYSALGFDEIKDRKKGLHEEFSKERITFPNGCEIRILSASGTGERLMGFGGDLIIEDEAGLIDDDVYFGKITRMLGDSPTSVLVEIGNPFPGNHFEDNWDNRDWLKFHIGWKEALKEGRISQEFVDEQKDILAPIMFRILYEADFPEDSEDALIPKMWIERSLYVELGDYVVRNRTIGCDIAEAGIDNTVLTPIVETTRGEYIVGEQKVYKHMPDTMKTVQKIKELHNQFKADVLNVDAIGIGKGVADRLRELNLNTKQIKVSKKPTSEIDRFLNQKAQHYWRLRKLFEDGLIKIPKNATNLIRELRLMRYEISNGKIKIIDPQNKSPDYADSLMLGCVKTYKELIIGVSDMI